jgi:photosystem II stability/assembly factor-like uncharacterized protein
VVPDVTASSTRPAPKIVVARRLHDVRVVDATFVGPEDGWLLATADCAGGSGTCTAMLRTSDGGAHWTDTAPPPADVPGVGDCADPCVEHLRFATTQIGYAFGPGFLFMTTDGGTHWTKQLGGAEALEALDGNVIRVRPVIAGCTLGCTYSVETSLIGSTRWRPRQQVTAYQLALVRGGHDAYVLTLPHTSGNAVNVLYRSTDDGRSWSVAADPCARDGEQIYTSAIAAGSGGDLSVLCPFGPDQSFVAVSTDRGSSFTARGTLPGSGADEIAGDPGTVLLAAGDGLWGHATGAVRSTDGGVSWQRVPGINGRIEWLGFESATVGHIVSADGRTIWTTGRR